MTVVSNTSPLNYLVLLEAAHVLPELFGTVAIPAAVRDELMAAKAPGEVREWARAFPPWLYVHDDVDIPSGEMPSLHPGERAAIILAERLNANLVLLDERAARVIAKDRYLKVTGTLGILNAAGVRGLVDIPELVLKLRKTSFHASDELIDWLLEKHRHK